MPLYPFLCYGPDGESDGCGQVDEQFHAMADAPPIGTRAMCSRCGGVSVRALTAGTAPAVVGDHRPYWSDALGRGWGPDGRPQKPLPGATYDSEGRVYVGSRAERRRLQELQGVTDGK